MVGGKVVGYWVLENWWRWPILNIIIWYWISGNCGRSCSTTETSLCWVPVLIIDNLPIFTNQRSLLDISVCWTEQQGGSGWLTCPPRIQQKLQLPAPVLWAPSHDTEQTWVQCGNTSHGEFWSMTRILIKSLKTKYFHAVLEIHVLVWDLVSSVVQMLLSQVSVKIIF